MIPAMDKIEKVANRSTGGEVCLAALHHYSDCRTLLAEIPNDERGNIKTNGVYYVSNNSLSGRLCKNYYQPHKTAYYLDERPEKIAELTERERGTICQHWCSLIRSYTSMVTGGSLFSADSAKFGFLLTMFSGYERKPGVRPIYDADDLYSINAVTSLLSMYCYKEGSDCVALPFIHDAIFWYNDSCKTALDFLRQCYKDKCRKFIPSLKDNKLRQFVETALAQSGQDMAWIYAKASFHQLLYWLDTAVNHYGINALDNTQQNIYRTAINAWNLATHSRLGTRLSGRYVGTYQYELYPFVA